MKNLFTFKELFEKLQMVTTNWSIISNEGSFEKKEDNGYLVFNKNGVFSIIYNKKGEEARIEFYTNKENSSDKKSVCECKITTTSGADRSKKGFGDITPQNVIDIIVTFFDYSDLEKAEKNSIDKFLMGFTKSIKDVLKSEEKDQIPASFNVFVKYLNEISKKSQIPKLDLDNYDFTTIVSQFISYLKSNK
jgi:hypothetical protein